MSLLERRRANFAPRTDWSNILLRHFLSLLFFLFAVRLAWAVDPSLHISQYAHTAWRIQDGALPGIPNAIAQTKDGYIWIGTGTGLVRFDGVRFVSWVPPNGMQLPSAHIVSLLAAREGSLWIGTEVGLSRWHDERLTNYLSAQGAIISIIEDRNGVIWFNRARSQDSRGPLCQVSEARTQCYENVDGIKLSFGGGALIEDSTANLWIAGDTWLVRWKPGSSSTVYDFPSLRSKKGLPGIGGLARNLDGSLWVGMGYRGPGLGLLQLKDNALRPVVVSGLDGSTLEVNTVFVDHENTLWIGTQDQGIYRIQGQNVDHFGNADGLSSNCILAFYEDREGNLWVITTKGLDSFHDLRVVSFSEHEGLATVEADSVLASRDGTVWVGGTALDALHRGKVSSIRAGKGLPGSQITSLFEDDSGQFWVGIDARLWIYENRTFTPINRKDGSPTGLITGITEDVDHNIWAEAYGTPRTLLRIKNRQVQEEFPVPQMPAARRVAADRNGGIWLGLLTGDLARHRNGRTEIFHFEHTVNSNVDQVAVNPDGSVFGATAFGLIAWKNGKQQILAARNGLPCDSVNAFITDMQGDLWLYMQCGLVQISGKNLEQWWGYPDNRLEVKIYDAFDGAQPEHSAFQATARTPDGRLWFGNTVVLQMIDPDHVTRNALPPPVHVEEVIADRKNYSPRKDLRLPPLTRDLEIDYTALSFVVPQKVRFRYKLESRDAAWQEPGTRRQAFYTDLRPGKYRFRVIACNNDGVWNDAGATLDFSVTPAWFQTNWFRILCVLSGILVVWVIYRLRVRQIARAISARFDERLAERTRIARDLHDTFLQTIQGSKLVADDALELSTDPIRMRRAMEQLSVWLGRATQEGRAALNSLRSATAHTNDLAEAFQRATEECRMQSPIDVSFSVVGDAKEMHPVVRDEVYRIGYEAIRNACMHSGAGRLEVALSYTEDLTLRVSDNGTGIDPAIADRGKDGHFGLQGMRERATRIGGKLTLRSSSSSGTEIRLLIPGSIIFRKR